MNPRLNVIRPNPARTKIVGWKSLPHAVKATSGMVHPQETRKSEYFLILNCVGEAGSESSGKTFGVLTFFSLGFLAFFLLLLFSFLVLTGSG